MIINRFDKPIDISLNWREIPAFKNSTATMFRFTEISTKQTWRSASRFGFWYSGVQPHGSLVMVISEETGEIPGLRVGSDMDWAELDWHEIHHPQ